MLNDDAVQAVGKPTPHPTSTTRQRMDLSRKWSYHNLSLSNFAGDCKIWTYFWFLFIASVHANITLAVAGRLHYLKLSLRGNALHLLNYLKLRRLTTTLQHSCLRIGKPTNVPSLGIKVKLSSTYQSWEGKITKNCGSSWKLSNNINTLVGHANGGARAKLRRNQTFIEMTALLDRRSWGLESNVTQVQGLRPYQAMKSTGTETSQNMIGYRNRQ